MSVPPAFSSLTVVRPTGGHLFDSAREFLGSTLIELAKVCSQSGVRTRHQERARELSAELAEITYGTAPSVRCTAGIEAILRHVHGAPTACQARTGVVRSTSSCLPPSCFEDVWNVVAAIASASMRLSIDGLLCILSTGEFPELERELHTIVEESEEDMQEDVEDVICKRPSPELSTVASSGNLSEFSQDAQSSGGSLDDLEEGILDISWMPLSSLRGGSLDDVVGLGFTKLR
uniref:Uncharacterized protein n=1 Tax=Noctiluca scintillans TaxID=2966 RepID=A0A7S1F1A6_NOCSC|mmetsp:Transcript_24378/g.64118  ORF Transcript_24378/g.64118 Transcript_24378/m.64118 type:complete len:233 (+) Transcript_24378:62-760(+)|eukprot:CAMPEP_0194491440 /NCGR_PEP_ID=MMETSP0253-20130528/10321_1 /TAXON_ID=2966 /ORGANISM="Noctiluca scintillans" /LENGTH=232 /DNA_ID=CAMNT_0039332177 /DNA_START=45 /DNA_END=743 /DNA_ORIENTATION=+